eukprot:scaffold673772_cov46-Prasinocladus_malaysianus.AAC.1
MSRFLVCCKSSLINWFLGVPENQIAWAPAANHLMQEALICDKQVKRPLMVEHRAEVIVPEKYRQLIGSKALLQTGYPMLGKLAGRAVKKLLKREVFAIICAHKLSPQLADDFDRTSMS